MGRGIEQVVQRGLVERGEKGAREVGQPIDGDKGLRSDFAVPRGKGNARVVIASSDQGGWGVGTIEPGALVRVQPGQRGVNARITEDLVNERSHLGCVRRALTPYRQTPGILIEDVSHDKISVAVGRYRVVG